MYDYPADKELNFYFLPGCFRLLLSADNQNANSLDAIKSGPNKVISETQQQQLTKSIKGVPECKIGKLVNTFLQSRLFSSLFNPFSRQLQLVVCYLATSVYCKLQELRSELSQGSGLITIYIICFHNRILYHARIQRGTGGPDPLSAPENHKAIGFLRFPGKL